MTAGDAVRPIRRNRGGRSPPAISANWEWTEEKLTKDVYGEKTVYNYYCMVDYLGKFYPVVDRNKEPLTLRRLSGCDVLILKTPTRPYGADEIQAVLDFIRAGGGVWLVGDHTDVLGMGTYLNALSREFGIEFQPDSICGLREPWLQPYSPPHRARHPAIQEMRPMIFATSCSLRCGFGAWPVIISEETFADEIDYGTENFVADMRPSGHEALGSFIQCAAADFGRGRVLAFADSTLFSNFFFHLPGIHELALGSVEWLNRRDRWRGLRAGMAATALALAAACLAVARRHRSPLLPAILPGIFAGLGLGLAASDALARTEAPRARSLFTTVAFDYENPGYRMPLVEQTPAFHGDSYHTFFVWVQRMGLVPRLCDRFSEGLKAGTIVMVEPKDRRDGEALKNFVEAGGALLVLDDPANQSSTANKILRFSGLSFGREARAGDFLPVEKSPSVAGIHLEACRSVEGGQPCLVETESGMAVLATARVGQGVVAAFGAARLFRVDSMGETGTVPDDAQLGIYRLQYWLFEELLGLKDRPR